jgi:D-3-phosphoglycerate dehydrogenase
VSHRILVADPLHEAGLALLKESTAEIVELGDGDIHELIGDVDAVIVRSRTSIDAAALERGTRLKVIARAGVGIDNVDVAAATERGILVVNAPAANLVSAAEHTFALLLSLTRMVPSAHASTRAGEWNRSSFMGTELRGKVLAVIGFGRIGQAVARRAAAFGMDVVAADPFLAPEVAARHQVELVDLDDAVARADVITLHTPLTEHTNRLMSADRIRSMKPGALLINCARGGLVDEDALVEALDSGHLAGAALDVFSEEPPTNRRLLEHPAVVVTPHIGAQTVEAQERVATETVRMVLDALEGSLAVTAVNLPFRSAGPRAQAFVDLAERMALMAGLVLGGSLSEIAIDVWGLDDDLSLPLTVAATRGALVPHLGDRVNYVNASRVARQRGIEVVRASHSGSDEYPHLIQVTLTGSGGSLGIQGVVFRDEDPRVVRYDGSALEFRPAGRLLVLRNDDVPGVVGKLGTVLGDAGVNIAEIHLARIPGGDAIAVIGIDDRPSAEVMETLRSLPAVHHATLADLESGLAG